MASVVTQDTFTCEGSGFTIEPQDRSWDTVNITMMNDVSERQLDPNTLEVQSFNRSKRIVGDIDYGPFNQTFYDIEGELLDLRDDKPLLGATSYRVRS